MWHVEPCQYAYVALTGFQCVPQHISMVSESRLFCPCRHMPWQMCASRRATGQ